MVIKIWDLNIIYHCFVYSVAMHLCQKYYVGNLTVIPVKFTIAIIFKVLDLLMFRLQSGGPILSK